MIPEIRKILFTSDLTETSKHAYGYALSLAQRYSAEILFLYVMDETASSARSSFLDPKIMEKVRNQAADEARISLSGKRRDMALVRSGIKQFCDFDVNDPSKAIEVSCASEVIVTEGDVVDKIIQTAQKYDCDTIVMGSRRRSALAEAMFGSVVKGVLRRSDRMVIIAPPIKD
jgi:nucleotide-binding universal stress UspA family protein